jgi:DNA-binding beta-propeller fold protein YncE
MRIQTWMSLSRLLKNFFSNLRLSHLANSPKGTPLRLNREKSMRSINTRLGLALTLAIGSAMSALAASATHYHLTREIPIPGDGGWDYLTFSPEQDRLFVTHDNRVFVLDGASLQTVGTILDVPGVHGVAIAPDLGRGYITAGRAGKLTVFDTKSLERIVDVETTGQNPDAVLYDSFTRQVFTFNGRGRNITVIDAQTNAVKSTIAVDAKPEFAVSDGAGHIYVNLEDKNSLAAIDTKQALVTATWAIPDCEEPSGLALDKEHHRLFSVCGNRHMAVLDAQSGKSVASVPIGAGVDGVFFDTVRQLAFVTGGDGTLTVVHEDTPDRYTVRETVATQTGARTVSADTKRNRIYTATAKFLPLSADKAPGSRPAMEPNSFRLLVIEP